MFNLLLVIIYLAFISLGLPDSLVGSAWPIMHQDLQVPLSAVGVVTMIIAGGTIVSSLFSDRLTRKFGTGWVTAISVLTTALALFGFSTASAFWMLCLWAIPYGVGAGAVDAALNNYVAVHYASRHMNWLHCFWGVGASISPYIMGFGLAHYHSWNLGYLLVAVLQLALTIALFFSIPLWNKQKNNDAVSAVSAGPALSLGQILKIKGVPFVLMTFFGYCALEMTTGLWASSYLVQFRGIEVETAARFASLFYLGITFGRFLCGFISDRLGDKQLIRLGLFLLSLGILLIFLPLPVDLFALSGLVLTGIGCAPIYPAIIHATPANFGKEHSQAVIGVEMASAYLGTTFMPPLFGLIAEKISLGLYPIYLLLLALLMLVMSEKLNRLKS
ncbi:MFS transporter [Enterococcus sp. AZ109]|uniref:MFS transporter n=1 Tax=Enterococcus sp. AZ109 TaxID=2774634 RepID=UPI003F27E942